MTFAFVLLDLDFQHAGIRRHVAVQKGKQDQKKQDQNHS